MKRRNDCSPDGGLHQRWSRRKVEWWSNNSMGQKKGHLLVAEVGKGFEASLYPSGSYTVELRSPLRVHGSCIGEENTMERRPVVRWLPCVDLAYDERGVRHTTGDLWDSDSVCGSRKDQINLAGSWNIPPHTPYHRVDGAQYLTLRAVSHSTREGRKRWAWPQVVLRGLSFLLTFS